MLKNDIVSTSYKNKIKNKKNILNRHPLSTPSDLLSLKSSVFNRILGFPEFDEAFGRPPPCYVAPAIAFGGRKTPTYPKSFQILQNDFSDPFYCRSGVELSQNPFKWPRSTLRTLSLKENEMSSSISSLTPSLRYGFP